MFAEVRQGVFEQSLDHIPVKDVDAHRGQKEVVLAFDPHVPVPFLRKPERGLDGWVGWLPDKARAPLLGIYLHDPEGRSFLSSYWDGRDGNVRANLGMHLDDLPEIHSVELVTAE